MVAAHNGGAALQTPTTASSTVQRSHCAHTPLAALCHSRCRLAYYSCSTLRLRHAQSQDTCRTSAQHSLPAPTAAADTDNTRATPHSHCNAAVAHACTQRCGTHDHEQSTAKTIPRSVVQSHSSHSETRCRDAHATTQNRNRSTAAQHPTHCAQDSAGEPTMNTQDAHSTSHV